jgi:Ni2+-binding GTPase involved in maturation of urease and hydrogenase
MNRTIRVVFFGPPGAGKTSLAIALLRATLECELSTAVLACDDDADRIARRYKFAHAHRLAAVRLGGLGEAAELKAAIRAPVLVDQRQLLLPLDDNYFCRSDVVLTARAKLRG